MSNDKLLREIGATLGTLAGKIDTALTGSRPPCEVPCASTGCDDNTGGVCTGPGTCVRGYIKPLPAADGACNVSCRNETCEDRKVGANTCQRIGPCFNRAPVIPEELGDYDISGDEGAINKHPAPSAKGVCSEPCINIKCGYMKGGTCLQPATCSGRIKPPADVPVEELLQGYTLAQWDEIRKGGYLCQFRDAGGEEWTKGVWPLEKLAAKDSPRTFKVDGGPYWEYCRPAQIPGVLRPWFGGDCPVDPDTRVLVKFRDGGHNLTVAGALEWDREIDTGGDIIAYMEV